MSLHDSRRARATAVALGAATTILISSGIAVADDALPGATGNTVSDEALPGATGNTTEPAPQQAAEPQPAAYNPPPAAEPVPQPVQQVVPQITQQPIQSPEPVYITRTVEVPGEDRVITETVEVAQPQGEGLYIGTSEGRKHVNPENVTAAARENYQDRDRADKNKLHEVAGVGAVGAVGGGLVGAGLGAVGGAAGDESAPPNGVMAR